MVGNFLLESAGTHCCVLRNYAGSIYGSILDWLTVSIDGSTIDVADTPANELEFGRSKCKDGYSAFPKLRLAALVENGTRVLFGMSFAPYATSELALAWQVIAHLKKGMLCLCDRYYAGYDFWVAAAQTGADLLWRLKKSLNGTDRVHRTGHI